MHSNLHNVHLFSCIHLDILYTIKKTCNNSKEVHSPLFCKQNKIRCSFRNFGEYFSENKTASTHTSYFFCHFMYCVCAKINFSQCHCSFNCNGFYRKQILTQYTIDIVNGRKERREKEFCCQSFWMARSFWIIEIQFNYVSMYAVWVNTSFATQIIVMEWFIYTNVYCKNFIGIHFSIFAKKCESQVKSIARDTFYFEMLNYSAEDLKSI